MVCTFFGHRDTSWSIEEYLKSTLTDLIENKNVDVFYVGSNGNFDSLVIKVLKKLKEKYTHIRFFVVLAYLNKETTEINCETVFPDGLENVPPKFAISKRNMWMIEQADYVVTYVEYSSGGAAKFEELAKKKGKIVINIVRTFL